MSKSTNHYDVIGQNGPNEDHQLHSNVRTTGHISISHTPPSMDLASRLHTTTTNNNNNNDDDNNNNNNRNHGGDINKNNHNNNNYHQSTTTSTPTLPTHRTPTPAT